MGRHVAVLVRFTQPVMRVQVYEGGGTVEICTGKNLQTIYSVELDLVARNGNATGNCSLCVYSNYNFIYQPTLTILIHAIPF